MDDKRKEFLDWLAVNIHKGIIDLMAKDKVKRNVEAPLEQKEKTRTQERLLD